MEGWQKSLSSCITSLEELARRFPMDVAFLEPVVARYPLRVTRYYLNLIRGPGDAIWRQCVPDVKELEDGNFPVDPLNEEGLSPVPGLIHRYPDRVVLLLSPTCPTLCRFCMRKPRFSVRREMPHDPSFDAPIHYIEGNTAVRDVILSGGDPFLLADEAMDDLLSRLRNIHHVEMIRINTRIPVTFPERITVRLCRMLKRHHPLYVNTHFNHPTEITPLSTKACQRLADAGIPLGNQTVLLKEVNDDPAVMKRLMQRLLAIRVRPYYIHHMDPARGTRHFRTPVDRGLEIMAALRGHTSGLATPYYVVDLPGGKGKVPLLPENVKRLGNKLLLKNYLGETVEYPEPDGED